MAVSFQNEPCLLSRNRLLFNGLRIRAVFSMASYTLLPVVV